MVMRLSSTLSLVFGVAIAFHALVPSTVRSDKDKIVVDGKKHKVKCGDGYGAIGPHKIRQERGGEPTSMLRNWRSGELYWSSGSAAGKWVGCGSPCTENNPLKMSSPVFINVRARAQIYEHASGHYLFFGSAVDGSVRSTDPLVFELEDGKRIELYPVCDTPEGSGIVCGIYNISQEELKALASTPAKHIRHFFRSGEGVAKVDVRRTEEGREYVEFEKPRKANRSIQPVAHCMSTGSSK